MVGIGLLMVGLGLWSLLAALARRLYDARAGCTAPRW